MIFFYDVMLIDDDPVLKKPQRIRRQLLEKLVKSIKGRAKLASRREIEFSSSTGPRQLQAALASAITHRWEGLVLKPTDEPYFSVYNQNPRHRFPSCWIKFKKDYIPGLGDTADFAVVGASYTHSEAVKIGNLSLKWTDFYIGCLRNKLDVLQHGAKPQFTVLVALNQCIKAEDVLTLNRLGQFSAVEAGSKDATELFYLDYQSGLPKISVVFRKPFVFEVLGSGFDRMPNQTIHTLRFPRVLKIHWDRDWKESVGLDELQEMAKKARTVPAGDVSADIKNWYMRLEKINRGTKGLMAPWDNSQEERDTEDHTAIGALEASSQGQPYESPVFVRMDTNEMIREENRLQCGDAEDGRTLGKRRPSTSPSRQLLSDLLCTSDFVAEETVKCRKRIAERDVESDLRPSKKMNINQPASAVVQELDRSVDATHVTPLASITNLSRSRKTPPIKPQKNYAHSKFSLLNKLAIGTDERGKTNVQRTIPTSSSARETSVSQCTTDRPSQSTQNTEMESPTRATTLSQVSNSSISITESVPTAPIELCEESDDLVVQIPDLQESGVMLSPCVENIPYVLEDLLRPSKIPTTPFPNANTSSDDCNSMFKNAPSSESIVFLIESKRESASVEAMKRLVTILPKSPFAEIAIWDWRLLEAVQKDSLSDEDWEKVACKRFIGTLAWADESGEKVMQMDWGYGKVARIPAVLWNPGP